MSTSSRRQPYIRPWAYTEQLRGLSVLSDLSVPIDEELTIDGFEPDENY